ncbi:MAG: outer membrane protein assembly factor BamE [Holosporales bacterium]|jgi:outer membrane protein assembly factor BamE (lipoprotein component of BamABCDE complex)|nr:outer membrane protein assembly factor BamE [Holosporales bacterium]
MINRGYDVKQEEFNHIIVGQDTAQTVFNRFGSPTVRSTVLGEDGSYSWYYVSKKSEKNGFLEPKVVEQTTMIVTFKSNDVVKSVTRGTGEQSVAAVNEKTMTHGKTGGIVSEAFGGLGKYRKQFEQQDESSSK